MCEVKIMASVDQSMSKTVRMLETTGIHLSKSFCSFATLVLSCCLWNIKGPVNLTDRPICFILPFCGRTRVLRKTAENILKPFLEPLPIDEFLFLKWLFGKMALDTSYFPIYFLTFLALTIVLMTWFHRLRICYMQEDKDIYKWCEFQCSGKIHFTSDWFLWEFPYFSWVNKEHTRDWSKWKQLMNLLLVSQENIV